MTTTAETRTAADPHAVAMRRIAGCQIRLADRHPFFGALLLMCPVRVTTEVPTAATNGAELLFNCTSGQHSLSALTLAGADNLAGKILVDVSNPLDFSRGFPPRLTHMNDTSLAEELQAAFPALRVVKALNTVANPIMVNPGLLPEATDLPICGDDPAAKQAVTELLRGFGWERIVDLGLISQARGTEAWLLLWTRLYGAMRTPLFNMRLVRAA